MARGPDQKRTMNPNSLANLKKGGGKRGPGDKFAKSFKADLYALWSKESEGKKGTTVGQEILKKAAEKSPMAFLNMASGLLQKEVHQETNVKMDFAQTLAKLNGKMGNARELPSGGEDEEGNIIDVEPFDAPKLPINLDEEEEDKDA